MLQIVQHFLKVSDTEYSEDEETDEDEKKAKKGKKGIKKTKNGKVEKKKETAAKKGKGKDKPASKASQNGRGKRQTVLNDEVTFFTVNLYQRIIQNDLSLTLSRTINLTFLTIPLHQ